MRLSRSAALALSAGLTASAVSPAWAQPYPSRPIRILTSDVGGSPDFFARLVAQGLAGGLGQNLIVENRASIKATELASQAPADGYTLLFASTGLHVTGPFLQKVSYDPIRDFSAVSLAVQQPNVVAVSAALPVKSVKELIAYAKARPGELNYGSSSTGSSNHLSAELFNSMAGVRLVRINYKGMGQAMIDLVGGQVHLAFPAVATVMPHMKSGKVRVLAVASLKPYSLLPRLPTVSDAGLPGYESASVYGLLAPARTPHPVIRRLNHEMASLLGKPELRDKLAVSGSEPVSSTPEQMTATLKSEMAKWGKVIRDAGIKPQ